MKFKLRTFLIENVVPIVIIVLLAFAIPASGLSGKYLIQEILTRFGRNTFLVIALILPIMAGMGLNFSIPLGAMAGQIALIFIADWGVIGIPGILLAMIISLPISILLGWLCGSIMNKAKGQEMLTGYFMASLMGYVYMFFTLYVMGTIIPFFNQALLLSRGYGVRNSISFGNLGNTFDNFIPLSIWGVNITLFSYILIAVACVFIIWVKKTRTGQAMRAAGQDIAAADAAGIEVNSIRITAIIISTVLAGFGQIIYLQNLGVINTADSHNNVGLFSIATLLIGGASVTKASIPKALLGVVLFHLMFLVAPSAARKLTDSPMLGEYLRLFIVYGVILLALVSYLWKRAGKEKDTNVPLLNGYEASTGSYKSRLGLLQIIIAIYLLVLFVIATLAGFNLQGIVSVMLTQIGMNGIFVLALVPMIQSGCGLNFGLSLGVIAGLLGAVTSIEMGFSGVWGFIFAIIVSQVFGAIFGYVYGILLNRVKGGEMIVSIHVGFPAVMLASIAWHALPFKNPAIVLSLGGEGLRENISLSEIWARILDNFLAFGIAGFKFPTGLILFFMLISLAVWAFYRPKFGAAITNRTRVISVVISTMLAALGIIVYQQSEGFVQLNNVGMAFPAAVAIFFGGAGINKASFTNVFTGCVLYQGILIMTPIIFSQDTGAIIVSIISYVLILYALTRRTKVII